MGGIYMKKLFALMVMVTFLARLDAGTSDNHTVTLEVSAINEIAISGGTVTLTVNTATAGSAPTAATDSSTATYAVTTNGSSKKVTAALDSVVPSNTTLSLNMGAPTGGSSSGAVNLTNSAQDMVTGISTLNESGLSMSYSFTATADAGTVASTNRTMTLTLADGS